MNDPIVYDLLQNIVNSYGKTEYKLDARGHLLLFSQLLLWSYKTEAPIDDKVDDIMCNTENKRSQKNGWHTQQIY
jgi:hypothetical protein